jgi:septal ring-binding cell division protein DamX
LSSGAFKEGRRLLDGASFSGAAGQFAAGVAGRRGMYTVQLALACETSTIARALGSLRGATQFFILPTTYKGQACYRMLWGAYSSKSEAAGARGSVPPSFLKDPHPPVVAPL